MNPITNDSLYSGLFEYETELWDSAGEHTKLAHSLARRHLLPGTEYVLFQHPDGRSVFLVAKAYLQGAKYLGTFTTEE